MANSMLSETNKDFPTLLPVYFAFFLDTLGLAIIYPILTPLFLNSDATIFSTATAVPLRISFLGVAIAAFPFAQFLSAPVIGEISDHIGRKRTFVVTISGTALGYIITALAILLSSFSLLLIGRLWTGLFAGNLTLCFAALADLSPDALSRTKKFSRLASIGGISFLLGIILGGSLSGSSYEASLNFSIPFWLIAFFSFINLFLMFLFYRDSFISSDLKKINFAKGFHNIIDIFKERKLLNIYAIFFFFVACWSTSMQYLSAYLIRLYQAGPNLIELTFIGIGLIWALTNSLITKKLSRMLPARQVLLYTLPLLSFLLLLCWFNNPIWVVLAAFGICTFCAALAWTNCLTRVSLVAEEQIQGRILGINQSIGSLASIAGPLLGGLVAQSGIHWTYLLTGISASLAFIFLLAGIRAPKST